MQTGDRRLKLLVAEGESVPGPILEIGNTNSRYRFPIGARAYVNNWSGHGPAHHCAVGVGHVASKIEKLGSLLDMDVASDLLASEISPCPRRRAAAGSGWTRRRHRSRRFRRDSATEVNRSVPTPWPSSPGRVGGQR